MLLTKIINVKVSNRTKKFFYDKGYKDIDGYFYVDPNDMNDSNRSKVECECDYCKSVSEIYWHNYLKQMGRNNIYSCHKCHINKSRITNIEKYGMDSATKLDETKNKIKSTCLDRYDSECFLTSSIGVEKIKKINYEKYGTEYPISSEIVRDKIKNTMLDRYGVDNLFRAESPIKSEIVEKLKISLNDDSTKKKRIKTTIDKYGVDNIASLDITKNKIKKTNLDKYGHEHVLSINSIKEKAKKTNSDKYGYEYFAQTEEWKIKTKETRIKNGYQIPVELKSDFSLYRLRVDKETKKIKDKLFENWDGLDFYDGEYIKDNIQLYPNSHKLHPTIDHKISVYYGFNNNIPVDQIFDINNLCITKRSINSKKGGLTYEMYINPPDNQIG
jgi:hypothetical protein